MGVLQEFLLPLAHHAWVQVEISANGIEFPAPPWMMVRITMVLNSAVYFFFGMMVTSYLI